MIFTSRKWRLLVVSAVLVMALGSACHASLLGLTSMFPNTQGENGWYAKAFNPDAMSWRNLDWIQNQMFKTADYGPNYIPMAYKSTKGYLIMHPGISPTRGAEWAVVQYVAPTAGQYNFSVEFSNGAGGSGCTTRALVFVNDAINAPVAQSVVNLTTSAYFAYTVNLQAGDRLNFAVDPMGNSGTDSTVLKDLAPAVPEPASMLALAAGLIGLVVRRRK